MESIFNYFLAKALVKEEGRSLAWVAKHMDSAVGTVRVYLSGGSQPSVDWIERFSKLFKTNQKALFIAIDEKKALAQRRTA